MRNELLERGSVLVCKMPVRYPSADAEGAAGYTRLRLLGELRAGIINQRVERA
jgi:hypothetical protein